MRMLIVAFVLTSGVAAAQDSPFLPGQPSVIVTSGDATGRRTPDRALVTITIDARSRADAAAAGAGLSVDEVLRIEDRRDAIGPVPRPMMMAARSAEATTPIEPGLIEIRAHVSLSVSIT